jgi:hypothetical protein
VRCPDLLEEIIDARKREAMRGAANHDLGPQNRSCGDRSSVSFICCCVRTRPVKAGEAVIVSTGLLLSTDRPWGREVQSSAFFRTPDMP